MRVSLNWLNQYFSEKINKDELVKKYNLMSQEVSGLYKLIDVEGLTIGHIKSIKKHEDADKLSVCMVDVGDEELQIICGAPNVDANQKVIVAKVGVVLPGNFKLKKAKIRGIESHGMICSLAELGIQEFDSEEKGIYVLGDDAIVGEDPLTYLHLNDYVLDLDLTANRSDLLSLRGVAYDTASMLDLELDFAEPKNTRKELETPVNIYTQTKDSSAYYGQILENIEVKQSPYWIKSRLIASGIRPINNVVDITNYVMLEYGQPLHAFDYDKINSERIIVRKALKNETIITLDGEKRNLLEEDIVITDGTKPIALAGVMGGLETEINSESKRILLESAIFDPVKIRKTANRLNLKSESSSRFEKGIDSSMTLEAINYASELLVKYANAIVIGLPSYYNSIKTKNKVISLSLEKLNSVTGYDFNKEVIEEILERLRFKFRTKGNQFKVTVPTRRPMESYQDLIEEIVRINGYDKIPVSIPTTPTQGGLNGKQKAKRQIRNFFVGRGFIETKTYSLVSKDLATYYDKEDINTIRIMNPLTKEREHLRHSLLPSLINVLEYNNARKIDDIFIFEIGNTYFKDKEIEKLSLLLHGRLDYSVWQKQNELVDFYHLKGLIETLLKQLKITNYIFKVATNSLPHLHPGISAVLLINNEEVGFLGKLHPEEEHRMGIKDVYVSEINLSILLNDTINNDLIYQEVSKYPTIDRDLAILVNNETKAEDILSCIKNIGKKILNNIEIFDVYNDKSLNGKKSIALSLEFQSPNRTLETKEVDDLIFKILESLKAELKAELRT